MIPYTAHVIRDPAGYVWALQEIFPEGHVRYDPNPLILVPRHLDEIALAAQKHVNVHSPLPYAYDPFIEEPALFRIFAHLEPTEEAIEAFANKYGDIAEISTIGWVGGTYLEEWRIAIETMRKAVIRADNFLAKRMTESALPRDEKAVVALMNEYLPTVPVHLAASVVNRAIGLHVAVTNLHDAMKLQLAVAIAQEKRYRTCEFCGKPFELMPKINRADRLFCTSNCRVKSYQHRKKQVIVLSRAGRSISQIAEETKTDLRTAKSWIKESKEK